jgi:hypothetical protein
MAFSKTPLLRRALPVVHTFRYRSVLSALLFTALALIILTARIYHGLIADSLSQPMDTFQKYDFDAEANAKFGSEKCAEVPPEAYDVRATSSLCFQCETALEETFRSRCTVGGSQKCLSSTGSTLDNVEIVPCDSVAHKDNIPNWSHTKDGLIRFKKTNCLSVKAVAKTGGGHGKVHYPKLEACSKGTSDNMKWSMEASSGFVKHRTTQKCLTYLPETDKYGSELMLRSCDQLSGGLAQAFDLYGIPDGTGADGKAHSKVTALAIPEDINIADRMLSKLKAAAMLKLRTELEKQIKAHVKDISDEDVTEICNMIEALTSVSQLEAAFNDPQEFFTGVVTTLTPLLKKAAMKQLRVELQPRLDEYELEWEQVSALIESISSLEAIKTAIQDPQSYFDKLLTAAGPVAKQFALALLKPKLTPILEPIPLNWTDVLPAIELISSADRLQKAVAHPDVFLKELLVAAGPAGKKVALAKLRPALADRLKEKGLEWDDVAPAIELMCTVTELTDAVSNPGAFVQKLVTAAGPAGKKIALATLRPKLEPELAKLRPPLTWEDVSPAIDLISSIEQLKIAVEDPGLFMQKLTNAAGPAAEKIAMAHLKVVLLPLVERVGMDWEDVLPAIELLTSIEELQEALVNPNVFLGHLLAAAGPAGKKIAIAQLRPVLTPLLEENGLSWDDAQAAIDMLATVESLQQALQEPNLFLGKLRAAVGPVGKKFALAKLRPYVEPELTKRDLTWEDILPVLELMTSLDELQKAFTDPEGLLAQLAEETGPLAKKVALAKLRPHIEPKLAQHSLTWADVLASIDQISTINQVTAALANPEVLLEQLMAMAGPLGKKIVLAKLRPVLEPRLEAIQLTWEDLLPAIDRVCTIEKLKIAVANPDGFVTELLKAAGAAGKTIALAKLRPILTPPLEKAGLIYEDAVPAIELISTIDELQKAFAEISRDPDAFVKRLLAVVGPAGKKIALAKLRPVLTPLLEQAGLDWADAKPALDLVGSIKTFQKALSDPEAFARDMLAATGPAGKKMAIAKAKPMLTPLLEKLGLGWDDAQRALDGDVVTLERLQAVIHDPTELLTLLDLAQPIALAAIRPTLAPLLEKEGLSWEDAVPIIGDVFPTAASIRAAGGAKGLLDKLLRDLETAGKKIAIAQLRPVLTPLLEENGLSWDDAQAAIELDLTSFSSDELRKAVQGPAVYLKKLLATKAGDVGKQIAIALVKPILSVRLARLGVRWEDAMPVLAAWKTAVTPADIDRLVATIGDLMRLDEAGTLFSDPMEVAVPVLPGGSKLFAAHGTSPALPANSKAAKPKVDDGVMVQMKNIDSTQANGAAGNLGSQGSVIGTLSKLFGANLLSLPQVKAAIGNAYGYPLVNGLYHSGHMAQTCTKLPLQARADTKYFVLALTMNDKGFCLAFDPRSDTVMFWLDLCVPSK